MPPNQVEHSRMTHEGEAAVADLWVVLASLTADPVDLGLRGEIQKNQPQAQEVQQTL